MPAHISEFELFRLYSKEIKNFLSAHAYLSRYPIDENVTIAYATPPRAFAKYLVPVINGGNLNPTITFHLESMEYGENENLLGFVTSYRFNGTKYESVSPPLVYKLNYKAVIMVATPSDADILQFELLAAARKNKKHASKVDGQWCEIVATNPMDDSPTEPGEGDKIYRRSLTLTIPRAYLPMEYIEYGIIQQVNVKLETVDEIFGIQIDKIPEDFLAGNIYPVSKTTGILNKNVNLIGNLINATSKTNGTI